MRSIVLRVQHEKGKERKIKRLYIHIYRPTLRDELGPGVKCEKGGLGNQITWEDATIRKFVNLNSCIRNDVNYIVELTNNL